MSLLVNSRKMDTVVKRPKIQRLVTPVTLARKRRRMKQEVQAREKSRAEAAEYAALLQKRIAEQKEARRSEISKRRSSRKASKKE